MATLTIKIEKHEKDKMILAVAKHKDKASSVATIAKEAKIPANRARFIMEEMIAEGSVRKVVAKKFNDKYIRYKYEVTGK